MKSGVVLAETMQANLGGTDVLAPLTRIFKQPVVGSGQCQVFLLTDGEVPDTAAVLDIGRQHIRTHRCFTLGIGAEADAGLVEGRARVTGGKSAFVGGNDDLSDQVIPHLECSFEPSLLNVSVHLGDVSSEVAPFPIPALSRGVAATFP